MPSLSRRKRRRRHLIATSVLFAAAALAACEAEPQKPSENNTYNVHLYYGKDMKERRSLGRVLGISRCKTAVHTTAAQMGLKPQTYSYDCCWVNAGDSCYQKHK